MKKSILWLLTVCCLPVAAAEPINIDISTPPVIVVKHSITQRYSRLVRFYEAGTIGQAEDGLIYIRDGSHLSLPMRQIAEKLIDVENNERRALVVAISDSNGRPTAQAETWALLTQRWKSQFKPGWWLRDAQGHWVRKP